MQCQACGRSSPAKARFCSECGAGLAEAAPRVPVEMRPAVFTSLRGEERLVTVVFADMTESVRRTTGLDAEEAAHLVNPLLEVMVELMVRHGGRIDRFLGDGVLAVFGVPVAHEDDPIRAVRAALQLRERAADLGVGVTVGINTGRVYFGPVGSSLHEELTVMGPVVNLAARLQGAAGPSEVLIGEATRAHVEAAFQLTAFSLSVKGLAEPVTAYRAERLLDHPDKVRGIRGLRADLIGRDAELERLTEALGGRGGTFVLVGPAGVGKSRLAAEFHHRASEALWLEGLCLELSGNVPFGGFLDMLRSHLGNDPLPALLASLERLAATGRLTPLQSASHAAFLAHLLGEKLGDDRDLQVAEADAEQRKTLTIGALVEYLLALGNGTRLVVFLDDLHWADPLTLEAVAALQASSVGREVVLLLGCRPPAPAALLPDGLTELPLRELTRSQSRRLIRQLLAESGLPIRVEETIIDQAQGNPFYVEELIRSLIQLGVITRRKDGWAATADLTDLEVPESVEGVIMSRFDRLSDATRTASRIGSILDGSFSETLFARLAGPTLLPELTTMVEAGLIALERSRPQPVYSFVHALTRQAIYHSLLPSQRAELHERTAEALEDLAPGDLDRLTFHYERSRNHRKAVDHLLAAAEQAVAAFMNDTADQYLERALERVALLPEEERPSRRARLLARRGELAERMAEHREARRLLQAALAEADPDPLEEARIWRLLGQTHRLQDNFEEAHRSYDRAEQALDRLEPIDPSNARRAWIEVQKERAFALYFGGRGLELDAHNQRVGEVVGRYGTLAQRADHLYGRMLSSFKRHRFVIPDSTVAEAREAVALARAGADPGRVAGGMFALGFALLWADRVEEAAGVLEEAVDECRRVGAVIEECRARAYLAIALRRCDRVEEAERAAHASLELAERLDNDYYLGHARAVLAWVALRRGEDGRKWGELAYRSWGGLERGPHRGLSCEFGWLAVWPLVAFAHQGGDREEALSHLRHLRVPWERPMPPDLAELVDRAIATGDTEVVAESLERARRHRFV